MMYLQLLLIWCIVNLIMSIAFIISGTYHLEDILFFLIGVGVILLYGAYEEYKKRMQLK